MTLPDERTLAILYTREFLIKLSSPYLKDGFKKIPMPVRQEARALLRHFPNWVDLTDAEHMIDTEAANHYGELEEKNKTQEQTRASR
jgi:hypothetical protein